MIGNEKATISTQTRVEKDGKLTELWSLIANIRRNIYKIQAKNLTRRYETEI